MSRYLADRAFAVLGLLGLLAALAALAALLLDVILDGAPRLSWQFLTTYPSRFAASAGILPAILGTFYVIVLTGLMAVPVGVAAAVYLEEYGAQGRLGRIIEINIANLAGVPSIVYGLLGLGLFVRALGLGRSVVAGAATLALLVLPVVILATREALRAVPKSLREGSVRARRHAVADDAAPGPASGAPGHSDRYHPGALAGDRRDGAAHHRRRGGVRPLRPRFSLVTFHGPSDSDLQLGVAAAGGLR